MKGYTLDKLAKELEIMSKLKSNFVVQYVNSWSEQKDIVYIQMEFCGYNLKHILDIKRIAFGRQESIKPSDIDYFISYSILNELLLCVQYLHSSHPSIIHRDLKPENILIKQTEQGDICLKLCDFGLSTFQDYSRMPHTQGPGTLKYIAPEVSNGRLYDTRADVYSLAIIIQDLIHIDINE